MTKTPLTVGELNDLITGLNRLAHNLWWTWDQEAQELFHDLSPRGWQNLHHNAVAILREVSDYELRVRLQDSDFAARVRAVLKSFDAYMNDQNTWTHQNASALHKNPVAYFSAEFGFHETLPIDAGIDRALQPRNHKQEMLQICDIGGIQNAIFRVRPTCACHPRTV